MKWTEWVEKPSSLNLLGGLFVAWTSAMFFGWVSESSLVAGMTLLVSLSFVLIDFRGEKTKDLRWYLYPFVVGLSMTGAISLMGKI